MFSPKMMIIQGRKTPHLLPKRHLFTPDSSIWKHTPPTGNKNGIKPDVQLDSGDYRFLVLLHTHAPCPAFRFSANKASLIFLLSVSDFHLSAEGGPSPLENPSVTKQLK
jgi:hypothetical protein